MTRVPSTLVLLGAIAVAATAFAFYAWYRPTQYRFVERNHAAFATLPVYPSGHFRKETSSPYSDGGGALARVIGYTTTREYVLPTAIPAEAIVDYYLYELRGCVVVQQEEAGATFQCRKTVDVTVAVDGPTSSEHYELTVDSR